MNRFILILLAAVALSFSWIAHAAGATDSDSADQSAAEASAVPMETVAEPVTTVAEPEPQKPRKDPKHYARPDPNHPRPMTLDLRHCLELETNAEIAYCAGE